MVDHKTAYRELCAALREAGIENPNEARELFSFVCGFDPIARLDPSPLDDETASRLRLIAQRRMNGYPLQYLMGSWPFLDFELKVGEGVLIPRPDTECIVQKGLELLSGRDNPAALDLCSGSGCIAIGIKRALKNARVTAVELYDAAYEYLIINISELAPDITALKRDALTFCGELSDLSLDLITCNPPYVSEGEYRSLQREVSFEPRTALVSGKNGLFLYERLIPAYRSKLKSGGALVFETGDKQAKAVTELFSQSGYADIQSFKDCYGCVRGVYGRV